MIMSLYNVEIQTSFFSFRISKSRRKMDRDLSVYLFESAYVSFVKHYYYRFHFHFEITIGINLHPDVQIFFIHELAIDNVLVGWMKTEKNVVTCLLEVTGLDIGS